MSINYKSANPSAIGQKVLHDRALELEGKAYAMETEEACLNRILETHQDNENLIKMLEEAQAGVNRFRRAADRAAGASPLSPEEKHSIHISFLENWLAGLEQTHAERIALINEANRQMGLSGEDELNPEELIELQVGVDTLTKEVDVIEIRHKFCCEVITQLNNDPVEDDKLEELTEVNT